MIITKCKKCGSNNLILEPRIKGQNVLNADIVALKCRDCGIWLKWCPKNERQYYFHKQLKDNWKMLKEWLQEQIEKDRQAYIRTKMQQHTHFVACEKFVLEKMQELESFNEPKQSN